MNDAVPHPIDIPGYRILRKIARGGTATVYLAEEARLGRLVALKILAQDFLQRVDFTERFLSEGKIAAGLHHPNIVTIHNMGVAGDHHFIAMEYISGEPLSARIASGVALEFAILTVKRIAVALGFAHAHGVIHRDVTPSNILFRENRFPVLTDFGIAKALEADSGLTLTGTVMGTASYMSPQQARGDKIDHRSDLYSLGVVLFEMLASKRPFVGDTPVSTAVKHAIEPIPKLPQSTAYFQPIIDRSLAKLPEDRFQNAAQFIKALDAISAGQGGKTEGRSMMVFHQDIVQSLPEKSTDPSSGMEKTRRYPRNGKASLAIKPKRRTNGFPTARRRLAAAAVVGLILLVFAISKLIHGEAERDYQRQVEINDLLEQAKEHAAASRYMAPKGNNAVAAYRKILEQDSDNDLALSGLATIEKKFVQAVAETKASKGPKQALSRVERFQQAAPESTALNDLRSSIEEELAVRERSSRIATLMKKAKQQQAALRLTEPEGDSAYATFREILRLDTGNTEARQGIKGIIAHYQSSARNSGKSGDFQKALSLAEKGLQLAPDNAELIAFRSKVQRSLDLENRIANSLAEAAEQIERGNLLEPKGQNAYAAVTKVLDWDPENANALELKRTIEGLYIDKVTEAFEQGQLRRGQAMVERGNKVFKDQKDLALRLVKTVEAKANVGAGNDIDNLLDKSRKALWANRLAEPNGDNAIEYAAKVLRIKPGHGDARGILQQIVGRYVVLGAVALRGGRIDQARGYQQAAKRLVKNYWLAGAKLQKLTVRLAATHGAIEPDKAQASPGSEASATLIVEDGKQEREEELKQLRQQLDALQSKGEKAPREKPKKVFLPPAF